MGKSKRFSALKNWLAPGIEEVKNCQLECKINMKAGRLELDMNSVKKSKEAQKQMQAAIDIFKVNGNEQSRKD